MISRHKKRQIKNRKHKKLLQKAFNQSKKTQTKNLKIGLLIFK